MREAVRLALCEAGALRAGEPLPPFSVRMSGNLIFLVYPGGDRFYLAKLGLDDDLSREFNGLETAHGALPQNVPRPLLLTTQRSFPALVAEGIAFAPLGPAALASPGPALRRAVQGYIEQSQRRFRRESSVTHSRRVLDLLEHLPHDMLPRVERHAMRVAKGMDSLPWILQHGDFSVSNLGMRDQTLVVVDWEEFGRVSLPGYDVAVLLLSLNDFDVLRVVSSTAKGGSYAWIAGIAGVSAQVPRELFLDLLPIYLAILAGTRAEASYGSVLRARVLGALTAALDASASSTTDAPR